MATPSAGSLVAPQTYFPGLSSEDATKKTLAASRATSSQAATSLFNTGTDLTAQGTAGIAPIMDRLLKILKGDSASLDFATQPEQTSVLRQYDTARRSSAQFGTRGGGSASANIEGRNQEASDLATTRSKAVSDASGQLSQLMTSLLQVGTSTQASGLQGLLQGVESLLQERGIDLNDQAQSRSFWGSVGKAAAEIALYAATPATGGASAVAATALLAS